MWNQVKSKGCFSTYLFIFDFCFLKFNVLSLKPFFIILLNFQLYSDSQYSLLVLSFQYLEIPSPALTSLI